MNAAHEDTPAANDLPPAEKRVCAGCVGEDFLRALIAKEGQDASCNYCDTKTKTIMIGSLADHVERAFEDHYECTPTEPEGIESIMHSDRESKYHWERRGDSIKQAIADAAGVSDMIACDVQTALSSRHGDKDSDMFGWEYPYSEGSHYARKDVGCGDFYERWSCFLKGLQERARFFSSSAKEILDEIFEGLAELQTHVRNPVVVEAGPGKGIQSIYRARVFAAEDAKLKEAMEYPWQHLGPPPMQAASAGRMNARGISVFYGALDEATALAEVRPPVGSKVAIARFAIERSLRLLDVEALRAVTPTGSIFDPGFIRRMERSSFLKILSDRISQPVMPNEEAFEYLATQAVADYLASEAKLDGIVFPAVQIGGASKNIVLFHHASRVVEVQLPTGTQLMTALRSMDSDGESPCYSVCEIVPLDPIKPAPARSQHRLTFPILLEHMAYEASVPHDTRAETLSVDHASMTVRHVKAVCFDSDIFPVDRYRHSTTKPS